MSWPKRARRSGYTLTELLVSIAIGSILLGLLLTSLRKGRASADSASCMSSAKQLNAAWLMYANDNNEIIVPNVDGLLGGFTNWVAGNMANKMDATDFRLLTDRSRSLLAPYVNTGLLFKCPADESKKVRSVSMNCRLNPRSQSDRPRWVGDRNDGYMTFRTLGDIARATDTFVFIDESDITINDGFFAVDMSNTGDPAGVGKPTPYFIIDYPASFHSGAATVSFADGHIIKHHWRSRSTFTQIRPRSHVSAPNIDMSWLQAHCTYLRYN